VRFWDCPSKANFPRDSCTKDQEWIISPLGGCENIFIAAGGSFHAWKFLPNLGKYIVEMMNGKLDAEKANRWAWDRPVCSKDGACDTYAPKRDLNDLSMAE
jgi:sarcosine oxidase / L-pipecolate oxidase